MPSKKERLSSWNINGGIGCRMKEDRLTDLEFLSSDNIIFRFVERKR
jgi:hypothetical protein